MGIRLAASAQILGRFDSEKTLEFFLLIDTTSDRCSNEADLKTVDLYCVWRGAANNSIASPEDDTRSTISPEPANRFNGESSNITVQFSSNACGRRRNDDESTVTSIRPSHGVVAIPTAQGLLGADGDPCHDVSSGFHSGNALCDRRDPPAIDSSRHTLFPPGHTPSPPHQSFGESTHRQTQQCNDRSVQSHCCHPTKLHRGAASTIITADAATALQSVLQKVQNLRAAAVGERHQPVHQSATCGGTDDISRRTRSCRSKQQGVNSRGIHKH